MHVVQCTRSIASKFQYQTLQAEDYSLIYVIFQYLKCASNGSASWWRELCLSPIRALIEFSLVFSLTRDPIKAVYDACIDFYCDQHDDTPRTQLLSA